MIICKEQESGICQMVLDVRNWEYSHVIHNADGETIVVIKEIDPMGQMEELEHA